MPDKPQTTPSEMVLHTTVRIDKEVDGEPQGIGTGFLLDFSRGGEGVPALVTCRHVLEGEAGVRLTFTTLDAAGQRRYLPVAVDLNGTTVVHHPDPSIDLCAIPLIWVGGAPAFLGQSLGHALVPVSTVPTAEEAAKLSAVEDGLTGRWERR